MFLLKTTQILSAALLLMASMTAKSAPQDIVLNDFVVWSGVGGPNLIRITLPSGSVVNSWSCTNPDSYFVSSALPQVTQFRILAILLAAKAMAKPVTIRVDNCESDRPANLAAML